MFELLLRDGILRSSEQQPIFAVDGSQARWMLDSLGVSLTTRGASLCARALLDKLRTFDGTRLATYGTTGLPLMQAVIDASNGRYSGLVVRKEIKAHGARLRVQGPPGEGPVVIIDDSVSSGFSVRECAKHLQEAGHDVEGAVVLVRFGYDGVAGLLDDDGLRVESVFDAWRDVMPAMPDERDAAAMANPGKWFPPMRFGRALPEKLSPPLFARRTLEMWLRDGVAPKAPKSLDRRYDGAGGVFVSLRTKADVHERPARGGFWHFPEEKQLSLTEELVKACVVTAEMLKEKSEEPLALLADCKIAVTFFSRLEPCEVGQLDNDVYGIVARSRERRGVMGGALPCMPGIRDGWHQFKHAAWKNGGLYAREPYELFRHHVEKVVEPGEQWQPTGVPKAASPVRWEETDAARPLVELAQAWARFHLGVGERPAPSKLSLEGLAQVFISPYLNGALLGCGGDWIHEDSSVDFIFDRVAEAASHDARFEKRTASPEDQVSVVVSLLRLDLELGDHDPDQVMTPTRFGQQALEVRSGPRGDGTEAELNGILLPYVVVSHDLSPVEYAEAVVRKAGISEPPYLWTRYHCASWLASDAGVVRVRDGLPQRSATEKLAQSAPRLGGLFQHFLQQHPGVDLYRPFFNEQDGEPVPARRAHAAWVKARAGLRAEASDDLAALPSERMDLPTAAFAALARHALKAKDPELDAALLGAIGEHGRIGNAQTDQDYAPGQVLYALARSAPREAFDRVRASLRFYRRRFRAEHAWGSVAWLTLAFSAWSERLKDPSLLDFAVEVADWALRAQAADGAFRNDHQPDAPGATCTAYLEGFAGLLAVLERAKRRKDAARLRAALERGFHFVDRLTYQPLDFPILPNPTFAAGGVRASLTSGEVRSDFVQHALSAVLFLP